MSPTPNSDPEGYLALNKFSRVIKCKRTSKRVSYADLGDPSGTPLLFLLPSGCSRWFAASQDPLATRYRIRLIAVDRPGVGATEMVPLRDRIRVSCEMIISVMEHLNVKPRHILAHSAGIYYTLHLLTTHLCSFDQDNGLPRVYLVSPWSPILPSSHPDYYFSHLAWVPPKVIETQHVTLPALISLANGATSAWSLASSTLVKGFSFAKTFSPLKGLWTNGIGSDDLGVGNEGHLDLITPDKPLLDLEGTSCRGQDDCDSDQQADMNEEDDGRLWGKFPCCVGCTTTQYVHAENYQGVGQEHLLCLNHGTEDTGYQWMESKLETLSGVVKEKSDRRPLDINIWWGLQDGMVPRKAQLWLNKAFQRFPDEFNVAIHEIEDADHADLMGRVEGIHRVYGMVWETSRDGF